MNSKSDAAGRLDFLALVVVSIRDDRLGAIFVGSGLGWRKLVRRLVELFIISPVRAAYQIVSDCYKNWPARA